MPSIKTKSPSRSSPGQPPGREGPPQENSTSASGLKIKFAPGISSTPQSAEPSPQPSDVPESAALPAAPQSESQRRVRLQEAFRERGLDERNLAGQFAGVMTKLSEGATASPKSHLDGLKEWIRVLAEKGAGADEPPVMFQIMHSIPRPVREKPAAPPKPPDDKIDPES